MSRITDIWCRTEKVTFKYTANIDKTGLFSATLPANIVEKLESAKIHLGVNRLGNKGYFTSNDLKGLREQIKEVVNQYSKRELVEEKIVLLYALDTTCSYCKTKEGKIVPNGYWTDNPLGGGCKWYGGTIRHDAGNSAPYGFSIYVEPKFLKVWKFPNGDSKTEYARLEDNHIKKGSILEWLDSVVGMNNHSYSSESKQIDYTEGIGLFFKNTILYICNLNEKLQSVFNKDIDIQKAIEEKGIKKLPIF